MKNTLERYELYTIELFEDDELVWFRSLNNLVKLTDEINVKIIEKLNIKDIKKAQNPEINDRFQLLLKPYKKSMRKVTDEIARIIRLDKNYTRRMSAIFAARFFSGEKIESALYDVFLPHWTEDEKNILAIISLYILNPNRVIRLLLNPDSVWFKIIDMNINITWKNFFQRKITQLAYGKKNQSRIDESISFFELASEINPENPIVWIDIGNAYLDLKKDFVKSMEFFEKANKIKPNLTEYWASLGNWNQIKKDYSAAIKNYNRALKENPQQIHALIGLGIVYLKKNEAQKALDYFREAEELDDDNLGILMYIGMSYLIIGDYEKSKDYFDFALEIDPGNIEISRQLILVFIKTSEYEKAEEILNELKENVPNDSGVWYFSAVINALRKEEEEMLENLYKAKTLNPEIVKKVNEEAAFSPFRDDPDFIILLK